MLIVPSKEPISFLTAYKITPSLSNNVIVVVALTALACLPALFLYYYFNMFKAKGKDQAEIKKNSVVSKPKENPIAQQENPPDSTIEKPREVVADQKSPLHYQSLTLAQNGVNQYQAGGPAACTSLACRFLSSKLPCSSEMLEKLILENDYKKDTFIDTDDCIQAMKLHLTDNPWDFQRPFGPTLQVSFERLGNTGISEAAKTLIHTKEIDGAIVIANGLTIAIRKRGSTLEFFDSHGDSTITGEGNAAYVLTFNHNQHDEMVNFLMMKYPDIGFSSLIEIWPIQNNPVIPAVQTPKIELLPTETSVGPSLPGKIRCEEINWQDESNKLYKDPNFYFDIPTIKHYESSSERPPESMAPNLLQIKIDNPHDIFPLLPANLQEEIKKIPPHHLGTASLLVAGQATYRNFVDKKNLTHQWHDFYFQGPLARLQIADGKGSFSLVKYKKGQEETYSWMKAMIGMFGRFGHAKNDPRLQEAIDQLSANRNYHKANADKATPLFMPFDKLDRTEQQIHNSMTGAHGTSVFVSGDQPIEGGFVLCHSNPLEANPSDFGPPLWHLSLVMICNTDTTREIRSLGLDRASKIDLVRQKLNSIQGSESAVKILDHLEIKT